MIEAFPSDTSGDYTNPAPHPAVRCLRILVPKSFKGVFSGSFLVGSSLQVVGQESKNLIFILSTLCLPNLMVSPFWYYLYPWGFRSFLTVFNIYGKQIMVCIIMTGQLDLVFLAVPTQFFLLQFIWKKLRLMERNLLKLESWTW